MGSASPASGGAASASIFQVLRAASARSSTVKSKFCSSSASRSKEPWITGRLEMTAQCSGRCSAKERVPMRSAQAMISFLCSATTGRTTSLSVARSMRARFLSVWLETWAEALAGHQGVEPELVGRRLAAISIRRLSITPM